MTKWVWGHEGNEPLDKAVIRQVAHVRRWARKDVASQNTEFALYPRMRSFTVSQQFLIRFATLKLTLAIEW